MRGIQSVNDPNQIPSTDSKKQLDFLRNVCEDCFRFNIESGTNFSFLEVMV